MGAGTARDPAFEHFGDAGIEAPKEQMAHEDEVLILRVIAMLFGQDRGRPEIRERIR